VGAFWCRYCHGETESGAVIAPNDPNWPRLQQQAHAARTQPAKWLEMRDIFGDIADSEVYLAAFSSALDRLWQDGTRNVLRQYLDG